MSALPIRRALLSLSDKTGITDFAAGLVAEGVELISTGKTAASLREGGLVVHDVAELTGFPEILGGRLKTLHPVIHGGLLYKRGETEHEEACAAHHISPIDLVVIDLYPFEKMAMRPVDDDLAIENIDIGGPAMIRSAAKNYASVTVIVDPADRGAVLAEIRELGGVTLETRRRLAGKAYERTAAYDGMIAQWFAATPGADPLFLATCPVTPLRYGENPHQKASFYRINPGKLGVVSAKPTQGKPLSYNNIADADAAMEIVAEFDPVRHAAVAIVKHANPCGVAIAQTLADAYKKARACDSVAAFGGIVACNRIIDPAAAEVIIELFTEVVVAPDADEGAKAIFARKKNLRLLLTGLLPDPCREAQVVKSVSGGFLVQERDRLTIDETRLKVVSKLAPMPREWADLRFAFLVVKHVKSNAIVLVRDGMTWGIGAGQMSRVDAVRLAVQKAEEAARARGSSFPPEGGVVMASDAFFPFADGVEEAIRAGTRAIIQPGGSLRDEEVIAAANKEDISMVFTRLRHFRH